MAALPKMERTIARRSQPPRHTSTRKARSRPHELGQIAHQNEPVVTSKYPSGRPLLTGTAPQTEFALTYSKQTTGGFLTGARTHIRIFSSCPFLIQISAQLIQESVTRYRAARLAWHRVIYFHFAECSSAAKKQPQGNQHEHF